MVFGSLWTAERRFGDTHYRFDATSGVYRRYRRSPPRFMAHFVVRWARGDIWKKLVTVDRELAALEAPLLDNEPMERHPADVAERQRRAREIETHRGRINAVIRQLPCRDYLVLGRTGQHLTCELIVEQRWRTPMGDFGTVRTEDIAQRRLYEHRTRFGWNIMECGHAADCFKQGMLDKLVKQFMYDKLASTEWPSVPHIEWE